jgi:hypothetical protein
MIMEMDIAVYTDISIRVSIMEVEEKLKKKTNFFQMT